MASKPFRIESIPQPKYNYASDQEIDTSSAPAGGRIIHADPKPGNPRVQAHPAWPLLCLLDPSTVLALVAAVEAAQKVADWRGANLDTDWDALAAALAPFAPAVADVQTEDAG